MDGSRIPYAFVICWLHVVVAKVAPPSNVTLHCHNMQNTLQWSYDEPSPGLKFKVDVQSISRNPVVLWVDAPTRSMDLSSYSDPANEYWVTVSAVNGSDESDAAPEDGITFSYFMESTATQICIVDLPLVNVTAHEDKLLHFSFMHPGLLYITNQRARKKKSHDFQIRLPEFSYHVEIINQKEPHNRLCTKRVCEGMLPVDGNQEIYCLNIKGEMSKMSVRAPKPYCSLPLKPENNNVLAYTLPFVLVGVGIVIIASMVYIKKTRPSTEVSNSLNVHHNNGPVVTGSPGEDLSEVLVGPYSPKPLLSSDEDTSGPAYESNGWMHVTRSSAESERAEGEQGEGEGYTQGKYLDTDEEEGQTAYEKRNLP